MTRLYLLFHSTHETLKAESVLKEAGLAAKVVMKPAAIRSDCGLAVRIAADDGERAVAILQASNLDPRSTHTL